MTTTFANLRKVCKAKGLEMKKTKKSEMWKGIIDNEYRTISIHAHAEGRDVPTGTFNAYIKELGFETAAEFTNFLNNL